MYKPRICLAAVSDAHLPKYLNLFRKAVDSFDFSKVDVLILAGDMVLKGRIEEYGTGLSTIRSKYKGRIYAVFGNEEYQEQEDELRSKYEEIVWLNDELKILEVKGVTLGMVGSRGVIDRPTTWQARNIPNISLIYSERVEKIRDLLSLAKRESDYVVLVSHYAVICDTLRGEKPKIWAYLGSTRVKKVVKQVKPDVVIHGHAHNSLNYSAYINGTKVYNVALPATKRVTFIELGVGGILKFL